MDEALGRWHHASEHTFRQGPSRPGAFLAGVLRYDEPLISSLPTIVDRRP